MKTMTLKNKISRYRRLRRRFLNQRPLLSRMWPYQAVKQNHRLPRENWTLCRWSMWFLKWSKVHHWTYLIKLIIISKLLSSLKGTVLNNKLTKTMISIKCSQNINLLSRARTKSKELSRTQTRKLAAQKHLKTRIFRSKYFKRTGFS